MENRLNLNTKTQKIYDTLALIEDLRLSLSEIAAMRYGDGSDEAFAEEKTVNLKLDPMRDELLKLMQERLSKDLKMRYWSGK